MLAGRHSTVARLPRVRAVRLTRGCASHLIARAKMPIEQLSNHCQTRPGTGDAVFGFGMTTTDAALFRLPLGTVVYWECHLSIS